MYLALVGCSIFKNEVRFLEPQILSRLDCYWLPQRLHNRPLDLRKLVQQEIDTVDRSGNPYDAIVLLYGLCSKGTVGIFSRNHRLVVPKVQDCIAVLLGSNRRYRDHFTRKPGTYWFTRGWIETGFNPGKRTKYRGVYDPYRERYREYRKQFDRELSQYLINEWDQRWIRNYTTLAFIDWGMEGDQRFREKAEESARALELEFENIEGDTEVIVVLDGDWADPPLPQDKRLTVLYYPESIGQREAANEAVRVSKAKYIMKIDAHCSFDKASGGIGKCTSKD